MATPTQKVVKRLKKTYGVKVYRHADFGSKARAVYALRKLERPVRVTKADTVVQHITVTLDTGPTTGDFKKDVRTVERIGLDRFGSGISYNWVVDMKTGEVAVGQPLDAKGTHTVNDKGVKGYAYDQNHAARAIAVLGMPGDKLSEKAKHSIASILAAMMDTGAITTTFDYVPHSLFAAKDCPCDSTRDAMPSIRKQAFELRAKKSGKVKTKVAVSNKMTQARALLEAVLLSNTKKGNARRAAKVRAGLKALPKQ